MTIELLTNPRAAKLWCDAARARGQRIGFVPTMGGLHVGHLSLVESALAENDVACVSVFVNPLQFGQASDLENYPGTLEGDARELERIGCPMVFSGTLAEFFPDELDERGRLPQHEMRDPGPGASGVEGTCRTGHFEGVATIVDRLFDVVGPDSAYFGQKDFQQTLVVRHLAEQRGGPRIVVCPTSREASGLARSSRNERLSPQERRQAEALSRSLSRAAERWQAGERDAERLEAALAEELDGAGVRVEYTAVRDLDHWSSERPAGTLERAVALVAAIVGPVHLLDNHILSEPAPVPALGTPRP